MWISLINIMASESQTQEVLDSMIPFMLKTYHMGHNIYQNR